MNTEAIKAAWFANGTLSYHEAKHIARHVDRMTPAKAAAYLSETFGDDDASAVSKCLDEARSIDRINAARRDAILDAGKAVIVMKGYDIVPEAKGHCHLVFNTDDGVYVLHAAADLGTMDRLLFDAGIKSTTLTNPFVIAGDEA